MSSHKQIAQQCAVQTGLMKPVQTDRPNEASAEFIKQQVEPLLTGRPNDTASSQNMWDRNLHALKVYVYNHSDPEEEGKKIKKE